MPHIPGKIRLQYGNYIIIFHFREIVNFLKKGTSIISYLTLRINSFTVILTPFYKQQPNPQQEYPYTHKLYHDTNYRILSFDHT